ncbi:MAG: hypothetical protein JSW66_13695 [Phycisphaerales bacterium]|nr:MAG: hypothetical protein JSW66_13695 [Phycisphaerales bacterium]
MKTTFVMVVMSAFLLFITGCGPGEPFEIEGLHIPQSAASTQVAAAK